MERGAFLQGIKDFLYGFLLHGMVSGVYGQKAQLEDLFILFVLGETIGVPVFPGFYSLRLIPYYTVRFPHWKKKTVKTKDLLDILHD
jgi:hypothetical protein